TPGAVARSEHLLVRLPGPHLTHLVRLFPVAHHDGLQPTQHRVVWRLPPKADAGGPYLHLSHSTISRRIPTSLPPSTFVTHIAEEVGAGVLVVSSAARVLAVHDLRLVGLQLKSNGPEPFSECGPQTSGLFLSVAMDYRIIRVALEGTDRVLSDHPSVERVVHEEVSDQRRDRRTLGGPLLSRHQGPVWHLHGGFEPPFDVEQDPALVGVVSDRFEKQIMGNAVEEGSDIKVQNPVLLPTAPSSHRQGVLGLSARPVAVTVRVEDRLQLFFQQHRCCGLGNSIRRVRHPEHPYTQPVILRYLHRPHRPGEVAPRTHPVPQLVKVVPLVGCEPADADGVHARRSAVRLDLSPRLVDETLSNLKRLRLRFRSLRRLLPQWG